ncbi:MAG: hydrogenase formation protein HypD [Rhodocyclaceae bacterium]
MRYVDEFRDGDLARALAAALAREVDPARRYAFMEFCGGHTHTIARYGLGDLLPPNLRMIHGPGCPVCVLPVGRIDMAIELLRQRPDVTLCTYGDCLRVPGSGGMSLLKAKAAGASVRMVYSPLEALALARAEPQREVVFFAIGFETTTPPTALLLREARRAGVGNLSVICNHVLTPPAMAAIVDAPPDSGMRLDGFVGPAHVSVVIGSQPYARFARDHRKPVVIAGFEPLDVLQAVRMLVRQVGEGRAEVENEFTRAVTPDGNRKAQAVMTEVFELREAFEWRGLGVLPRSALRIRDAYAQWDAERRFGLDYRPVADHKACDCAAILRGEKRPEACRLFARACTPDTPLGACMVSSEGACAAQYRYGRRPVQGAGAAREGRAVGSGVSGPADDGARAGA